MAHSNLTLGFDVAAPERGLWLFLHQAVSVDILEHHLWHDLVKDFAINDLGADALDLVRIDQFLSEIFRALASECREAADFRLQVTLMHRDLLILLQHR